MYKVGVQTKGLLPEKDIDEAFCMIHEAGFDCVDINIDAFLKNSDVRRLMYMVSHMMRYRMPD